MFTRKVPLDGRGPWRSGPPTNAWTAANAPRQGGKRGRKRKLNRLEVLLNVEQDHLLEYPHVMARLRALTGHDDPYVALGAIKVMANLVQPQQANVQQILSIQGNGGGDTVEITGRGISGLLAAVRSQTRNIGAEPVPERPRPMIIDMARVRDA